MDAARIADRPGTRPPQQWRFAVVALPLPYTALSGNKTAAVGLCLQVRGSGHRAQDGPALYRTRPAAVAPTLDEAAFPRFPHEAAAAHHALGKIAHAISFLLACPSGHLVFFPPRSHSQEHRPFHRRNEAPYLREWLEYHLLIGFDAFFILNDGSDDDTQCVLDSYADAGVLWRLPGDVVEGGAAQRLDQGRVFDTCVDYLKSHPDRFDPSRTWMMTHDTDEFVFLKPESNVTSVHEAVTALSRSRPLARSLEVPRLMFGSSGREYYDREELVTERFTQRMDERRWHDFKSISLVANMAQPGEDKVRCHNTHRHTVADLPAPKNETTSGLIGCSETRAGGRATLKAAPPVDRPEHLYLAAKETGEVAVIMHYIFKSRQEFYHRICNSDFSDKYYRCPTCSPETYFDERNDNPRGRKGVEYANDRTDKSMAPLVARTKERMARTGVGASCNVTPALQSLDDYRRCFHRIKPSTEATQSTNKPTKA